jgi:hypothetical protein
MTITQEHEIERLSRELKELRDQPIVADFATRVGNSIMTMLATIPVDKWPGIARTALGHEAQKTGTAYYMYLQRLPKE